MITELDRLKGRYVQELNRLYDGEIENLDVLPQMEAVAEAPAVKSALQ